MKAHRAAELIAREYLDPLRAVHIDTLILGCTHYPALRPLVEEVMGPEVRLVDSGREAAGEVAAVLERERLEAPPDARTTLRFTASDLPLRFRAVGRELVGGLIDEVERVDVEGALERAVS